MTAAERLKKIEGEIAELNIRMSGVGGGGGANHNLLSATHPDTDPDSPVRGDLLRGIAGPEWQRYAIGAAGRFLRSDGNDPLWSAIQAGDLPVHAAEHEVGGGDLVDHDAIDNYDPNHHIDHTSVSITAGTGLTGGGDISANRTLNVDVGIADDKIIQVDDADAADNDYAKFTANGLEGQSYTEVLSDLSAQAGATFDWNDQALTSIGATELYGDIKTDRWLLQNSNTFVGVNVVGSGNLAHGAGNEGRYNSAFGYISLYANTTGYQNSALGYAALGSNTSGAANSALGRSALYANTSGTSNSALGNYAGRFQNDGTSGLQTPETSVYLGANSKSGSDPAGGEDAIVNEIVIGYNAVGNGANTVTLGNTSITELHCQVALTVDSDERIKKDVAPVNTGLAFIEALNPITFKRVNPFDYPDAIKPPEYRDREITEKDKDGKDKTVLVKADPRPPDDENTYLGLSAQDVEAILTEQGINADIVSTSNRGKKSIKYTSLIMPLIKAVQELSEQNKTLSAKIIALEKR